MPLQAGTTGIRRGNPLLEELNKGPLENSGTPNGLVCRKAFESITARFRLQAVSMLNSSDQDRPEAFIGANSDQASQDVDMEDVDPEVAQEAVSKHFTVAIDFGTTFSSVSFIALESPETKRRIHPNQICSIEQYPYAPSLYYEQRREVPTESWYPKIAPRNDISDDELPDMSPKLTPNDSSGDDIDRDQHGTPEETIQIDAPSDPAEEEGEEADDESSREYFWGYGVQKQLQYPDTNRAQSRRIARSKLLLDVSPHTDTIRTLLRPSLEQLKRLKVIRQDTDVIADFLEHLFRHTKAQLTRSHGFHDACSIEFVLCVPAIWTQKGCRAMQTAMAAAISRSGFGNVASGSVDNLFIVSEPEAAAACVLADSAQRILVPVQFLRYHQGLELTNPAR